MPEFVLGKSHHHLRPADVIGKGGEADIYMKGSQAFKIFKPPGHPDLGTVQERMAAQERIAEHQRKLPAFPKNLPPRVMAPGELVRDKHGLIAGYEMHYLDQVEVLLRYGERSFRDQGVFGRHGACDLY